MPKDDEELKTCVTCRHYKLCRVPEGFHHGCARLGVRDIVTGEIIHQHCLTERCSRDKDACGWKAKFWQVKQVH